MDHSFSINFLGFGQIPLGVCLFDKYIIITLAKISGIEEFQILEARRDALGSGHCGACMF